MVIILIVTRVKIKISQVCKRVQEAAYSMVCSAGGGGRDKVRNRVRRGQNTWVIAHFLAYVER